MKSGRYSSRFSSRFANCREIEESEIGRPKLDLALRTNPIVAGQLEYLVQPIYDFYAVAVATAASKQNLFTLPIGQLYTPTGGAPFTKTVYHTFLVQAGMLDAPKKMLVKAPTTVPRGDISPQDLASFTGLTYFELSISGKPYWQATVLKTPAGAGPFTQNISTQTLVAGGTMANAGSNGWPHTHNIATITDPIPQIPGLDPMEPILGQLIEQNQNFTVLLDPTISGTAAFTTLAAAPTTQFVGTGINAHVFLEGILARAIL
jgi:hypothetical protein